MIGYFPTYFNGLRGVNSPLENLFDKKLLRNTTMCHRIITVLFMVGFLAAAEWVLEPDL
jgi:hypothetical protein